ncbi:Transglutaminase-like superfamily protein [Pseudonocardia thermophila]|mgnify:FL=1|jgi:Transglutaminase-like enzymes, putative cysteine proteases|uniref:Transglutaminase-like superfamily protein n=1 Tax=Pseudonocardia thermophila TaxID=1848 RepID=A0A1M6QUB4_PSETH|nr:transglutaminase family protein [Pseudonocardia thermophila]SHK23909.1 Transglutaminase-like superfamily protein [Pseudonocardia thermophila]
MADPYLSPGRFVDCDAPAVVDYARDAVAGLRDPVEQAVALFTRVRDDIWYDPFVVTEDPAAYKASTVVTSRANWCVPKAVLLTAAARAVGIPARLGFADVRNHLQTPRLRERMGGKDEFVWHGYSEMLLDGRWVKATPAFNKELCARFGVPPIDFDGRSDALLHAFTPDGSVYMTYGRDRGVHADLPLEDMLATFRAVYGPGMLQPADSGVDEFTAPG